MKRYLRSAPPAGAAIALLLSPANAAPTQVSAMNSAALLAAHPDVRAEMGFPQGKFSPSGKLFALAVDNIVSGDTDQVWIYDLADRKMVPATPPPAKNKTMDIDGFFWVGDTLYVTGSSGEEGGALTPFKRVATMSGAHNLAEVPPAPVLHGAAHDTTAAAGDELADEGDKREEDTHYVVTAKNRGGGAVTLSAHAKSSGRAWSIATGTWNLSAFIFDAPRAHVLYGDSAKGITIYDLKSREVLTTIPVAIDTLLDVTGDGRLAAYTALGRCDTAPDPSSTGPKTICFARLP